MRATAAVCEVCAAVSLHRRRLLRSGSGAGSSQGFSPQEPASSTAPLGPGQASDAMALAPATAVGQTRLSARTATGPGETEGTSRPFTASLVWGWGWPGPAAPQQPAARTPPRPALPRAPAGAQRATPPPALGAQRARGNRYLRCIRDARKAQRPLPVGAASGAHSTSPPARSPGAPLPRSRPQSSNSDDHPSADACHRLIPACKNQRRVLLSPFYG